MLQVWRDGLGCGYVSEEKSDGYTEILLHKKKHK